jgi:hypothetical protein
MTVAPELSYGVLGRVAEVLVSCRRRVLGWCGPGM